MSLEPEDTRPNVVLFGASGAGKSSIVNMLSTNEHTAPISSGVDGCTFGGQPYPVDILGLPVTLWDTPGLNEGEEGRVPSADAIVQLYKLLRGFTGGVSLLVFVMRAPRIMTSTPANWKLFREIICQGKVPAAIIITGLEEEENRQKWWWDHKGSFENRGIHGSTVAGVACVTASRGRARGGSHVYDEEYGESRDHILQLIRSTILDVPIPVQPLEWLATIAKKMKEWRWCPLGYQDVDKYVDEDSEALSKMRQLPGFSESFIRELRRKMREHDRSELLKHTG